MKQKRKIAVVTTTRAEYGLLYWLLKEISLDNGLELQLIVGGAHLSPEFGLTVKQIEQDGFTISEHVDFLLSSDSKVGVGKSMGLATLSFTESLSRLKPNIVVLLGDRWEILAVAMAASSLQLPIAHIHGGEVTQGALDDGYRHAVTKLSHIHFPACKRYADRVMQLGESEKFIFNHGAPGLDHIKKTVFLSREDIEAQLKVKFSDVNILCTFHPVTTQGDDGCKDFFELLAALDKFPEAAVIFTKPNADAGNRKISDAIKDNVRRYFGRRHVFSSLGTQKYLSVVNQVDVVLGNSSSGLIEVPLIGTPTVNVGTRQEGREMANTVISCLPEKAKIDEAISIALSAKFLKSIECVKSPYGCGEASVKIKDTLKSISMSNILMKEFIDYESSHE